MGNSDTLEQLREAQRVVADLEETVARAPHAVFCNSANGLLPERCGCWKARAALALGPATEQSSPRGGRVVERASEIAAGTGAPVDEVLDGLMRATDMWRRYERAQAVIALARKVRARSAFRAEDGDVAELDRALDAYPREPGD